MIALTSPRALIKNPVPNEAIQAPRENGSILRDDWSIRYHTDVAIERTVHRPSWPMLPKLGNKLASRKKLDTVNSDSSPTINYIPAKNAKACKNTVIKMIAVVRV